MANKKRINYNPDNTPMEIGKLPPQAVELEEAVLGAMLLEKEAVQKVIDLLTIETFYKEQNGRIFMAMKTLYNKMEAIDILTVTSELKRTEELEIVGGSYYVSALTNRIASSANIEFHCRILLEKALKRNMIRNCVKTIKDAYDDGTDCFELYAAHSKDVDDSLNSVLKFDAKKVGDIHADIIQDGIKGIDSGIPSGVPSGYRAIDKVTNGFQKSDLIIIAGRPGMGKTALAKGIALYASVIHKKPIAVFTLEVKDRQFVNGLQSYLSGINFGKITKKQWNREELNAVANDSSVLFDTPLYIDDTPGLSLVDLRAKARRLKDIQKIELIIIDYMQLMTLGDESWSREQEISKISRGLKNLAKELDIPIIALSQLSRATETRGATGKRPQLSDLRESGAIEQDADMVIFTYRPEYYEEYRNQMYEIDGGQYPTEGLFMGIIAKHRSGDIGNTVMGFIKEQAKVTNWDKERQCPEVEIRVVVQKQKENLQTENKNYTFVQENENHSIETNTEFLAQKTEITTEAKDKKEDEPF